MNSSKNYILQKHVLFLPHLRNETLHKYATIAPGAHVKSRPKVF